MRKAPNTAAQKAELLARFRELAAREGGTPGLKQFTRESGVNPHFCRGLLWPSWQAFVEEAGLPGNAMNQAVLEDDLLRPLAYLATSLRAIPNSTQITHARTTTGALPHANTYRKRFRNQAGIESRLLEWISDKPEFADLKDCLAPSPSRLVEKVATSADLPPPTEFAPIGDSFVPPIVDHLPALASGEPAVVSACERRGVDPNVELERRVAAALQILGLEVRRLGQGAGRVADGIATCRQKGWAIVYDAKLRRGGFAMRTEDRKFREYIGHHGRDLEASGIETIYFAVISSHFQSSDIDAAQQIVHGTIAKAVALVEASALRAWWNQSFEPGNLRTGARSRTSLGSRAS